MSPTSAVTSLSSEDKILWLLALNKNWWLLAFDFVIILLTFRRSPSRFKTMKKNIKICLAAICAFLCAFASVDAQAQTLVKRTTYKSEKIDFGAGGTVTIVGAPIGSIAIE